MTNDALYLIEIFTMQRDLLKTEMLNKSIRIEQFNRYSYGAWAIQELLNAVDEYEGIVTAASIHNMIRLLMDEFDRYYCRNKDRNMRYKHALNILEELSKISGGYIYEE